MLDCSCMRATGMRSLPAFSVILGRTISMTVFCQCVLQTPLGPMVALASGSALAALEFVDPDRERRLDARLLRRFPPHRIEDRPNAVLDRTAGWLSEYFAGRSAAPRSLALAMHGTRCGSR